MHPIIWFCLGALAVGAGLALWRLYIRQPGNTVPVERLRIDDDAPATAPSADKPEGSIPHGVVTGGLAPIPVEGSQYIPSPLPAPAGHTNDSPESASVADRAATEGRQSEAALAQAVAPIVSASYFASPIAPPLTTLLSGETEHDQAIANPAGLDLDHCACPPEASEQLDLSSGVTTATPTEFANSCNAGLPNTLTSTPERPRTIPSDNFAGTNDTLDVSDGEAPQLPSDGATFGAGNTATEEPLQESSQGVTPASDLPIPITPAVSESRETPGAEVPAFLPTIAGGDEIAQESTPLGEEKPVDDNDTLTADADSSEASSDGAATVAEPQSTPSTLVADHKSETAIPCADASPAVEKKAPEALSVQLPLVSDGRATAPKQPKAPQRYRPQQNKGSRKAKQTSVPKTTKRERACPIHVRFRAAGRETIIVSFLPRRQDGMPAPIDVSGATSHLQLRTFRDDWYEEVIIPDVGNVLRCGTVWEAETGEERFRWALSGRDLYVLGVDSEWSGYVSVPRLVLGDQHVVLCTAELSPRVEELLRQCCGRLPPRIDANDGLPEGWVGFRPVVPSVPLPLEETPDIFAAVRPSPEVDIVVRGGIRLRYGQWLLGCPPSIRLSGDVQHAGPITIDGAVATLQDGSFVVSGWDALGEHTVACAGKTTTYTLVKPEEGWEVWPAYRFAPNLPAICGPRILVAGVGQGASESILVAADSPLLLGARPGEIYRCPQRGDQVGVCAASPPFKPIWAVPANPLNAAKATARIRFLGDEGAHLVETNAPLPTGRDIREWCSAILNCARKGLSIDPNDEAVASLWRSYRDTAKRLWRAQR
ncbi:unnamed protein product [Gemmataceae bacterium]|nr:unnamed protein product [Gemmataceae bacterium]VTT98807.1 unnamed protein product [Gemmataceae bacterium]